MNEDHVDPQPAIRLLNGTRDVGPQRPFSLAGGKRFSVGRRERLVRVLIADSEALVRAGYRALLERAERIVVVGEAGSGAEAVEVAAATGPDVVLLDLGLSALGDWEGTAGVVSHPALKGVAVMLMVSSRTDARVFEGLLAGAVGVLEKDAYPEDLIEAVRVLSRGQALLPVGAVRRLMRELPSRPLLSRAGGGELKDLTGREREVLALAAKGLSNDEIAARLVVSPKTAKTHVSHAMLKLGAHHRAQLVALAYETGLVRPGDPAHRSEDRLLVTA
jgi:DNA-binding NarL/FixJ family response regulator